MNTRNRQLIVFIDAEPYYAAQKAQETLGMTYSALRNQVIAGNITAKTPKGRRQLYYRSKDVEQLSKEINVYSIQRRNNPTKFVRVYNREEIKQCWEISKSLFGAERGDIEKHMKIIEKNPETYYAIKDEEQIIGYTAIWPIKPGKLSNLLAQTIPVKISYEDIEVFEGRKSIDIYINVIGIKAGFTKEEKRYYGSRLIAGLIDVIVTLGERGISICTIGARK